MWKRYQNKLSSSYSSLHLHNFLRTFLMLSQILSQKKLCNVRPSQSAHLSQKAPMQSGFTLIELMITTGIVAILASVAIPNYISYTKNGEVSEALTTLINLSTRMEKRFLDVRNYGTGSTCGVSSPSDTTYSFSCTSNGQTYTWTATGPSEKYKYSIDETGARTTSKFDGIGVSKTCWAISQNGDCY